MLDRDRIQSRQIAIKELFPDDNPSRLAMMSRTPPHMIMPMVRLELIVDAMNWVHRLAEGADIDEKAGRPVNDGLMDAEEAAGVTPEEYAKRLRSGVNLLERFIEHWDGRMIGRDGRGREDMKELFGMQAAQRDADAAKKLILD